MAARKKADDSASPAKTAETTPPDTDEATAKAKADAEAKAEAEAKAKADEKTKAEVKSETKPFPILCHVRKDGKTFEPGATLDLTRKEFQDLERNQAVTGSFDD